MTNKEYAIMILEKLKGECNHVANLNNDYELLCYKKENQEIDSYGVALRDINVMINKLMED